MIYSFYTSKQNFGTNMKTQREGKSKEYIRMKKNWTMIQRRKAKSDKEYKEYLGDVVEIKIESYKEIYNDMKEIAKEVNEMLKANQLEIEYQECMKYKLEDYGLKVKVEKEECVTVNNKVYCRIRMDIYVENEEYIIELKTNKYKAGIRQLREYMQIVDKSIGFLIQYVKGEVNVLMMFRHNDLHYYIYDGETVYKHE